MYYPGFCDKYGALQMMATAILLPVPLDAAAQFAAGQQMIGASTTAALLWGSFGFFAAAAFGHEAGNICASSRRMGITRGGALVRKFQAAAYAIPVAAGLASSVMNDINDPAYWADEHGATSHENDYRSPPPSPAISRLPAANP